MSPALRGLALAAFLVLASLGAGAQTLTPSGDAHVRGGAAADNNYGGVVLLGVRTANNALNTYWSYLKFDTSGVSGQVREAKLRLLVALSSSGSVQTNLYAAPATWGETTITWNNKPALGAQLGSFTVANTGYVWFELDVTAHVRAELAQGAVGFALANPAVSSQLVAVQSRESSNPAQLVLAMNAAPSVTLTTPANGATYIAPATVSLAASAADTDGTIAKVEFFHGGTNLIATVTAAPYTFDWTNVAAGSYSLTAKATDDLNSTSTSAPVGITVSAAVGQLYFIHVDHLNTPRLVANAAGTTVWRWDQGEPFGTNPADENPSGLGAFDLPLRLPGQYFDKETNLHYNYFRDYDPSIGRYGESDPIGLRGGLNTYAYVAGQPLRWSDIFGLVKWTGSMTAISVVYGGGATRLSFDLTSECVKGKRGRVKVLAGGFAVGLGATFTGTGSSIEFEDDLSDVDPFVFEGQAKYVSAGLVLGANPDPPAPTPWPTITIGCSALQLGGATSIGCTLDPKGFDASVSGGVGISNVRDAKIECCTQ